MKSKVRLGAFAGALGAMIMATGSANAIPISNWVNVNGSVNSFEDQDGEIAFRNDAGTWKPVGPASCSVCASGGSTLKVGDVFVGGITIANVNGHAVGGASSTNETGGVFIGQINSVTGIPTTTWVSVEVGAAPAATWTGILSTALGTTFTVANARGTGLGLLANTMILWYEDTVHDQSFFGSSITATLNSILDGSYRMSLGGLTNSLSSDGTFWQGQGPADISSGFSGGTPLASPTTTVTIGSFTFPISAQFNVGLNSLDEVWPFGITRTMPSNPLIGGDAGVFIDFAFKTPGLLQFPEVGFNFPVETDSGLTFRAIPEPGSLLLLGTGLLGLAGFRRKRARA